MTLFAAPAFTPLTKTTSTSYSFYKIILMSYSFWGNKHTGLKMSVRYAILALLYQRPMYGYELGKHLASVLRVEWDVKPGHITKTLTRMEEANLIDFEIEAGDGPDRKVYHLADQGLQALQSWYLNPEIRDYRLGDAFYVKLVLSLLGGPVPVEQILMVQRRKLYQELHAATVLLQDAKAQAALPWLLLLETAVAHLEADLRWIDMCEARLPELKASRPPALVTKPRGRPRKDPPERVAQDRLTRSLVALDDD